MLSASSLKSKYLISFVVIICLIILLLTAYCFGYMKGQQSTTDTKSAKVKLILPSPSPSSEKLARELIKRCGQIPERLGNNNADRFIIVEGLVWSPDCRHIAWSSWRSGTTGIKVTEVSSNEGLFLYDDRTGTSQRIITPSLGQEIAFKEWKNRDTILYSIDSQELEYSLGAEITEDHLSCNTDSDCTMYNTSNCCGWNPINQKNAHKVESIPQLCTQECNQGRPACKNNECILTN